MIKQAGISTLLLLIISLMLTASPDAGFAQNSLEKMRQDASTLFDEGKYKEAIPILKDILKRSPKDSTALRYMLIYNVEMKEPQCRLGAAAFFEGDYKSAASRWQRVLDIDPQDNAVRSLINEALLLSNQDAIVMLYSSANRMIDSGRYNDATHELNKILDIEPDEAEARRMLDSINASIENSTIRTLYTTASELRAKGEYDLAIEALNRVLKLDPAQSLASNMIDSTRRKKHDSIHSKAIALYQSGQYIKARDQLNRLLTSLQGDKEIEGEYDRLLKVIKLLPDATGGSAQMEALRIALFNYISAHGSRELALVASTYAKQLSKDETVSVVVQKFMQNNIGRLDINSDAPESLGILEQYMLGALTNIYEGRYGRAIEQSSIVLSLNKNNALAYKRLGSAYYLMGNKSKASAAWQKALSLEPGDNELREFVEMVAK